MDDLLKRFKTKAAIARAMGISGPAVQRAFKKGSVPSTWVPKLIECGMCKADISRLPLAKNAADILTALP